MIETIGDPFGELAAFRHPGEIVLSERSHVQMRQLLVVEEVADLVAVTVLADDEPVTVWGASADVDGIGRCIAVVLVIDAGSWHVPTDCSINQLRRIFN